MLSKCTIRHARALATSLTESQRIANVTEPVYPLYQLADQLQVGADQLKRSINHEGYDRLTERFTSLNAIPAASESNRELLESLTEVMSQGVNQLLTTARNIVVPAIKEAVLTYGNLDTTLPALEIRPASLPALLQSVELTNHLQDYPSKYGQKEEYRTFRLARVSDSELVEMAATTKHMDGDLVRKWLSTVDKEELQITFATLFDATRQIAAEAIYFASPYRAIRNADQLLFAYFLTAHLRDNPQDPIDDSVTLEEWERALSALHGHLGLALLQMANLRQRYKREERLVLNYATTGGDELHVTINPDLVDEWRAKGGSASMLLGAGFTDQSLVRMSSLLERKEELEHYWKRKHQSIKLKASANEQARRRQYYSMIVEHLDTPDLPEVAQGERKRLAGEVLRGIPEVDLEDLTGVMTTLVCEVFFPNTPLRNFLTVMSKKGVDLNAREAATLATVELLASWLADQIKMQDVEFDLAGEINGSQAVSGGSVPQPVGV